MAKKNVVKVMLKSSESEYYKVIYKNPKKITRKLSFRKYDPILRRHVVFNEKKLPSPTA
ncbi:MAG: 50S ribosomal protein L33 [Rickettsiales bacterium]